VRRFNTFGYMYSITITKDGTFNDSTSPNGITNPGIQSLILCYKNTGNVTLTITDPLPGIVITGQHHWLPVLLIVLLLSVLIITQADINAGVDFTISQQLVVLNLLERFDRHFN
jgi:hypothetical protein